MKRILVILLFPLCFFIGSAWSETVLCIGDSITDGLEASESYPERLSKKFGAFVTVVNEGVPGIRTAPAVEVAARDLRTWKPDVSLILLGSNDVNVDESLGDAAINVIRIAQRSQSVGAAPIVGTIPPMTGSKSSLDGSVQRLNSLLRSRASRSNIEVVDVYSLLSADRDALMLADGLHPNDAGLEVIAAAFLEKTATRSAGRSMPVWNPSIHAFVYAQNEPWSWSDQFGVVRELPSEGWFFSSHFGNLFPVVENPWIYTERTGWTFFSEPTAGGYFWSVKFGIWLFRTENGSLFSNEWGDLYPMNQEVYLSPQLGFLFAGDNGWLHSDKFGWLYAVPDGDGTFFYSSRYGWIGRNSTQSGEFWSFEMESWI